MKALWYGRTLAESDVTILIEGNHYFPPESVNYSYLKKNKRHSLCYWKGLASYYDAEDGKLADKNIAWFYPKPTWPSKKIMGKDFSNYVAFWGNVKIKES